MAYDDWKLACPEGEDVEHDDGPREPDYALCVKHVGEVGDGAKYDPCGRAATVRVLPKRWPACPTHALFFIKLGATVERIEGDS